MLELRNTYKVDLLNLLQIFWLIEVENFITQHLFERLKQHTSIKPFKKLQTFPNNLLAIH